METTIIVIIALIGALMALWATIKPIMDDQKVRKKVLNFDEGMRNYYFLLERGEEEALSALAGPLEQKPAAYSFRPAERVVCFQKENVQADYRLQFSAAEDKTYLRVSRVAAEREPGNIPYLVNAFFIKNLRAQPVDYRKAQNLFPEDEE